MIRLLCFLLCLIAAYCTHAQPDPLIQTLQFYGDSCFGWYDDPSSFIQTTDGGYLLCGYTQRFNPPPAAQIQIWLARLDSAGNLLWENAYGYYDYGNAALETEDGSLVVAGWGDPNPGIAEFMLLKVSANGGLAWLRYYAETEPSGPAWAVVQTPDGGFALAGSMNSGSTVVPDMCLLLTDAAGNAEWIRRYDQQGGEYAVAMALTSDAGFVLVGSRYPEGSGDADLFVVRTNAIGDTLWQRQYVRPANQNPSGTRVLADGSIVVCGNDLSSSDAFLAKISDSGNLLWWRYVGEPDSIEGGSGLVVLPDGFVVAGRCRASGNDTMEVYLAKADLDGNELWHRTIHVSEYSGATDVVPLPDGSFALGGKTQCFYDSGIMAPDAFFIRTGPDAGSGVDVPSKSVPTELRIWANPNPFNETTKVKLLLSQTAVAQVSVFDVTGRLVKSVCEGMFPAGDHDFVFNGADLPTGIYFLRANSGESSRTIKIVLLK